jgi:hypothetical protein
VLLEETTSEEPSPWCFAVDTVLNLQVSRGDGSRDRAVLVSKHRFGAADPGPHSLRISREGIEVEPRVQFYRTASGVDLIDEGFGRRNCTPRTWGIQELDGSKRIGGVTSKTVCVIGPLDWETRHVALAVGTGPHSEILVDFNTPLRFDPKSEAERVGSRSVLRCGDPFLTPEELCARVIDAAAAIGGSPLQRVIFGDLSALDAVRDGDGLRDAVATLAMLFSRSNVPVILFESGIEDGNFAARSAFKADVLIRLTEQITATRGLRRSNGLWVYDRATGTNILAASLIVGLGSAIEVPR